MELCTRLLTYRDLGKHSFNQTNFYYPIYYSISSAHVVIKLLMAQLAIPHGKNMKLYNWKSENKSCKIVQICYEWLGAQFWWNVVMHYQQWKSFVFEKSSKWNFAIFSLFEIAAFCSWFVYRCCQKFCTKWWLACKYLQQLSLHR